MTGRIYQVDAGQVPGLVNLPEDRLAGLLSAANQSREILAGFWDDELLCLIGFVPLTFVSNTAYIWAYTTEAAEDHKLIYGRYAKQVVAKALSLYDEILGDCYSDNSRRWLVSLGAEFVSTKVFRIRRT